MTLNSTYANLGPVTLPVWQERQKYMHTFDPQSPKMAEGFEDYLAPVALLCQAAQDLTNSPIHEAHMTVDEKVVQSGMSQRRPGAHVDGDLEHIRGQFGEPKLLPANQGFLLSPDCVHESMVFDAPTKRTFLRIAYLKMSQC